MPTLVGRVWASLARSKITRTAVAPLTGEFLHGSGSRISRMESVGVRRVFRVRHSTDWCCLLARAPVRVIVSGFVSSRFIASVGKAAQRLRINVIRDAANAAIAESHVETSWVSATHTAKVGDFNTFLEYAISPGRMERCHHSSRRLGESQFHSSSRPATDSGDRTTTAAHYARASSIDHQEYVGG